MTTKQQPLNSGFGATTTTREALGNTRLDGTVAIVTGGYAGIGLETTRTLHAAGATVIVPARTPDKARAALAGLERVEVEPLDLIDPASIDAFASRFIASGRPLHLLINNAGIMASPLTRDARGYESQFATNHLGHFQLTARLWPALKQANGARVVCLSSRGHFFADVDFEDPFFLKRPYDKWVAYGQSKTANILFAVGLDARGEAHGVRAFAVHPGGILTELVRSMSEEEVRASIENSNKVEPLKTPEQGAATTVWCATSPQLAGKGGVYCENVDIAVMAPPDATIRRGVKDWAVDPKRADRLWSASEAWTGARFNP
ncbi:putative oxidoreductase [Corallococcus coralloides DSM 2259]|uniref:Probable oxidoreductase n=1 Tax=Corallococcus coralloides (strain ATCC 25202 / DSM 2259 / NBRC 100086 / M2) TaxID=1144275 RepID=H8MZP0_CORCM|nr:oxidoreductase [Corallococcus coralloides]AFE10729.1 putative oxidoreductase [Corallococcus coralloides DSM 2259]